MSYKVPSDICVHSFNCNINGIIEMCGDNLFDAGNLRTIGKGKNYKQISRKIESHLNNSPPNQINKKIHDLVRLIK